MGSPRTLFAFCVTEGGEEALLDLLEHVSECDVPDEDWQWVSWVDTNRDRVFAVVRGTMAARGAFCSRPDLARVIRLSVAARNATDNRHEWAEPATATEGRATLDRWMGDPGIESLTQVDIDAMLPPPAPREDPRPLVLQRRDSLERHFAPLTPAERPTASPRSGEGRPSGGDGGRHHQQRKPATSGGGGGGILAAFGMQMEGRKDSAGRAFSLYAAKPGAGSDEDDAEG